MRLLKLEGVQIGRNSIIGGIFEVWSVLAGTCGDFGAPRETLGILNIPGNECTVIFS